MRLDLARKTNIQRKNRSGDPCPQVECPGALIIYDTKPVGDSRVRYLKCSCCGHRPTKLEGGNKWIVPLEFAPIRVTRPSNDVD